MNTNYNYKEERELSYKSIENEEKEYRSLLNPKSPLFKQCKYKYDKEIDPSVIEELSLTIKVGMLEFCHSKKYLFHLLWCCKEESRLMGNENENVIDEKVLDRVLRKHPFCVTKGFSFWKCLFQNLLFGDMNTMDGEALINEQTYRDANECPPGVIQLFKMMNKLQFYSLWAAVLIFLINNL